MRCFLFVQIGYKIRKIGRLRERLVVVLEVVANPLLDPRDTQQFAIQRNIPVPIKASLLKGTIERDAMPITLGIGKRAVDIEKQGLEFWHVVLSIGSLMQWRLLCQSARKNHLDTTVVGLKPATGPVSPTRVVR